MKFTLRLAALLTLPLGLGCEADAPPAVVGQKANTQAAPPPAPPGAKGAKANEIVKAKSATDKAPAGQPAAPPVTPPPATTPPAAADNGSLKPAEVGVGVKGKDYGGPGFITTPVATKFRVEERIAFEVQIPNAMKLYKAEHNDKGPKTHEEFMDIIIRENGVALPDLAPGESFVYVPETEELLVRSPAPASQD